VQRGLRVIAPLTVHNETTAIWAGRQFDAHLPHIARLFLYRYGLLSHTFVNGYGPSQSCQSAWSIYRSCPTKSTGQIKFIFFQR